MILREPSRRRLLSTNSGITVLDQGVSSLSNLLISVLVAKSVGIEEFGVYALVIATYGLVLDSARALIGETLLIRRPALLESGRAVDQQCLGIALIIGGSASIVLVPLLLVDGLVPFGVLGTVFPLLIVQDIQRYVFFAEGRPRLALASDLLWLGVLALCGTGALLLGGGGVSFWVGLWGVSAGFSFAVLTLATRVIPKFAGATKWDKQSRTVALQLFGDFAVTSGSVQMFTFLIPVVGSLTILGAYKAAQVAVGPLRMLFPAGLIVGLPIVSQLYDKGKHRKILEQGGAISLILFFAGGLYTVAIAALPIAWGMALLGPSWVGGSELVVYVSIWATLVGVARGAGIVLRGTLHTKRNLWTRIALTPTNILLPLIGTALYGIVGLGVGLVLGSVIFAGVYWLVAVETVWRGRIRA